MVVPVSTLSEYSHL